jgi:hypothetical protein
VRFLTFYSIEKSAQKYDVNLLRDEYIHSHVELEKEMRKLQTLFVMILVSLAGSPSFAASGGTPNGKPFVEINGQISEVKGLVGSLERKVDELYENVQSLEEAMVTTSHTIEEIQLTNAKLYEYAELLNYELIEVSEEIIKLQDENDALRAQQEAISLLVDDLAQQVAVNENLIETLQNTLIDTSNDIYSAITFNETLLEELQQSLSYVEDSIELKQNIVSGECPEGESLYSINADGSLACRRDSGTTVGDLITVYALGGRSAYAECPEGTTILSGGFRSSLKGYNYTDSAVNASYIEGNGWRVSYYSWRGWIYGVTAYAYCAG